MKPVVLRRAQLARHSPGEAIPSVAVFALLATLYFCLTIGAGWRYSVDLQVLNDVVGIYPYPDDFGAALADNSVLVWMVLRVQALGLGDTQTLLQAIYVGAFALKTALLLRFFGWRPAVAITLLFFFSIDLNQARLSLAICCLLLAWSAWAEGRRGEAAVLLACGVVCHYPGALSLSLFFICGRHPKTAIALAVVALAAVTIVALGEDSPLVRYLIYLEVTGDEGAASFYLVTMLLAMLYWHRLSPLQGIVSVVAVLASFMTRDLVNLSGRVSELAATCILFCAPVIFPCRQPSLDAEDFALLLAVLFFIYRFVQWVLLGQVPLPSNL